MEFPELVQQRKMSRSFNGKPVPDGAVEQIVKLAAYSPSSWGGQPVEFIVVRDPETLEQLAACRDARARAMVQAEAVIVPIVDKRGLELWVEDAAVAGAFLLLAAEHYGVAACWVHVKDRRGRVGTAEEDVRALLGIPDYYGILSVIPLGMNDDRQESRTLFPVVHFNHYGDNSV